MPGPTKRPVELTNLLNNPGKRPVDPGVQGAKMRALPPAPNYLSEKGKLGWYSLGRALVDMNVLDQSDTAALCILCELWATWEQVKKEIERGGRYQSVTTKSGDVMERMRPCVADMADIERRLLQYLSHFGLTPSTRSKIKVTGGDVPDPNDPEAKYFN